MSKESWSAKLKREKKELEDKLQELEAKGNAKGSTKFQVIAWATAAFILGALIF